jgi:AraC family transcriptional regulator
MNAPPATNVNRTEPRGLDDSNFFDSGRLSLDLRSYRPGAKLPPHAHERASISVLVGGSLVERVGRTTRGGGLGAVIIKPAGTVHENEFGDTGTMILSVGGSDVDRLAHRAWEWRLTQRAIVHAMASIRHARAGSQLACEEALYLMLSCVSDYAPEPASDERPPPWLTAAESMVRKRAAALRIADVAESVGVHPVHLTRVFHRHFGRSVSRYVRRFKVLRAAELLRSSGQRVCDIAADLDFFDQSHLCRAFKAEFGISPREYRSLLGPGRRRIDQDRLG